jgi:aminopeptidase N
MESLRRARGARRSLGRPTGDGVEEGRRRARRRTLHINLAGKDPDEGMTDIAYEKGRLVPAHDRAGGGARALDAYLRSYFDRHAFQPMTASLFLADLRKNLIKGDEALEKKLMLDQWVYKPGIPANAGAAAGAGLSRPWTRR